MKYNRKELDTQKQFHAKRIENENIPQSYKDFMANKPENQMTSVRYGRRKTAKQNSTPRQDYCIYAYDMLIRNSDPDDKKSSLNYQWLSDADLNYKPLEGETEGITLEQIRKAFCFGSTDGGKLFFHPEDHSVWEIYYDLYIRQTAKNFEQFIKQAKVQQTWELK
ncbi:hypothetical protein [Capnocytophaga felis]|uniref:Knr4/Smi1-like domain-containing protein n=1 Tax=Capnocytophaga felis TaxID=2267611 RepID=A0A5M4B831_9FLAO|nr:hypothetical protein [Capnocytophaga felis]GET45412.1 hypothetical protein RCZ01_07140 [Capnocytophaga felis]GET47425.1 hypothetical protein RCZ02_02560 [Capnocytophaga felis]